MGLAPAGHHLDIVRHLPHRRAHAALRHAMGAAEIELDGIGPRLLDAAQDLRPGRLLAGHHQRDDHGAIGPVALHLLDLAQIDLQRPVGDQLDIVEADHLVVVQMHRAVARGDVHDRRILAQGLPDDAAPAGLEGAHDIVFLVGRRRGSQPEGIGRFDADEIGA